MFGAGRREHALTCAIHTPIVFTFPFTFLFTFLFIVLLIFPERVFWSQHMHGAHKPLTLKIH